MSGQQLYMLFQFEITKMRPIGTIDRVVTPLADNPPSTPTISSPARTARGAEIRPCAQFSLPRAVSAIRLRRLFRAAPTHFPTVSPAANQHGRARPRLRRHESLRLVVSISVSTDAPSTLNETSLLLRWVDLLDGQKTLLSGLMRVGSGILEDLFNVVGARRWT